MIEKIKEIQRRLIVGLQDKHDTAVHDKHYYEGAIRGINSFVQELIGGNDVEHSEPEGGSAEAGHEEENS